MRGSTPIGVTSPSGTMSTTRSPTCADEALRQGGAEDHPVGAGCQIAQVARQQMRRQVDDARLVLRQHAAQQDAGGLAGAGHHRLLFDVGRRGEHAGEMRDFVDLRAPIRDAALETRNGRMRRQAQDARAQLLLEAVHHRQHHDEHGDADDEAEDRDARDEREKAALRRCAQIPQTEKTLVPVAHHSYRKASAGCVFAACNAG